MLGPWLCRLACCAAADYYLFLTGQLFYFPAPCSPDTLVVGVLLNLGMHIFSHSWLHRTLKQAKQAQTEDLGEALS